jgi:hypothetical protein
MMRRDTLTAVAVIVLAGCATLNVSSHVERGIDFTQYRTFAWGPPDALPTGDPRLDNNPFFRDHMQGAVERELAARGYRRSDGGDADLLVHYHAAVNRRIEAVGVDAKYGYSYGEPQPQIIEYDQGTLVVDIVDARTKRVIWRGWAQESVQGIIEDQDRMDRHIDRAVRRMLALLPSGL